MIRFLHTADWQLGMRRHFLDDDAIPRYMQARIEAIQTMGELVRDAGCAFMVVCGDVYDSNFLDRRTVWRSLDALAAVPCAVYLLPGNHDPLDAGSIYSSRDFDGRRPDNVHVLSTTEPLEVAPGVELLGVPWRSRHPRRDLVAQACAGLEPTTDVVRICVAHGAVDQLSPQADDPGLISQAALDELILRGCVHYVALGDRHSVTEVGPRIWYAGTPEPTSFREVDAGHCLVVELSAAACNVERRPTGRWRFVDRSFELTCADDVEALGRVLGQLADKALTIVRLSLRGSLTLAASVRLDQIIEEARTLLASLQLWNRHTDLVVLPDDLDLEQLDLAGYARATVEELEGRARGDGDEAVTARDALALLYRVAVGEGALAAGSSGERS